MAGETCLSSALGVLPRTQPGSRARSASSSCRKASFSVAYLSRTPLEADFLPSAP